MNIQEFCRELNEGENPTALLKALRSLRSCDLDQFRKPGSLQLGWEDLGVWTEDTGLAQPPAIYVQKPELRS